MKAKKGKLQAGNAQSVVIILLLLALIAVGVGWWYWAQHHKVVNSGTATASCATSNLQLSTGNSNGTAGTMYLDAMMKNTGTVSCTLTGWPTVVLTDASNTVLGNGAAPTTAFAPAAITLSPGATAHVAVGFPDAGNFNSGACSASSAKLEVYPPASTTALTTPLQQQNCPGFSTTAIQAGN